MNESEQTSLSMDVPGYSLLSEAGQGRIREMAEETRRRGLPSEMIALGLRSTVALLMEQEAGERTRMEAGKVQAFLAANGGIAVCRARRAVPRRESKVIARDRLQERVTTLMFKARGTRRKHEVLSMRRNLLGLDQAHIRRTLGADGDALCGEINDWLSGVATRLNDGAL